jgi:hypothetical protein
VGPTISLPSRFLLPLQPFDAVQEVVFVESHESVVVAPSFIVLAPAVKSSVGSGGGGGGGGGSGSGSHGKNTGTESHPMLIIEGQSVAGNLSILMSGIPPPPNGKPAQNAAAESGKRTNNETPSRKPAVLPERRVRFIGLCECYSIIEVLFL